MTRRFGDRRTERFARGERVAVLSAIERRAEGRVQFLLAATSLRDVGMMPGWHLEALRGDRQGQWSIRLNDQWRICFVWDDALGQATDIEIVDYPERCQYTDRQAQMHVRERSPIHPGEILAQDVLVELDMSGRELARALGISPNRISEILRGRRAITADTALRLSRWLGTSPTVWLNLQQAYDLEMARIQVGDSIERDAIPRVDAA